MPISRRASPSYLLASLLVALGGCTPDLLREQRSGHVLDAGASLYRGGNRFGWGGHDRFVDEIQPILARRCVVCHGCTDSPCQLKLTSFAELERGATATNIFAPRPLATSPTRMKDARGTDAWRRLGFYSVLENGSASILGRLVERGRRNAPGFDLQNAHRIYEERLATRSFQCRGSLAGMEEVAGAPPARRFLAARDPVEGMPLGFERLSDPELDVLDQWLNDGSPGPSAAARERLATPSRPDVVARWEAFFNRPGERAQLISRYLFEHLFFARLSFADSPGEYYELVRSNTAAPAAIDEIVTERASDAPPGRDVFTEILEDAPLYYRLRRDTAVVVQKNHVVWPLDDGVMHRWMELFDSGTWGDEEIVNPGYSGSGTDENPLEVFEQIPGRVRYRFMLENAFHLVDAMVRGDVCHGSNATYAIRDRFWVWFLDPDSDPSALDPKLGSPFWYQLDPNQADIPRELIYLRLFEARMKELHPDGLSLDDLWDGDQRDRNAWLTVLRHGKSATVHQGAIGGLPETLWILSYDGFERLYYDLVVLFSPWGGLHHKIETWKYMSFVRSEAEDLFLSILPEDRRLEIRNEWIRGFGRIHQDVFFPLLSGGRPSRVEVGDDAIGDVVRQMRARLTPAIAGPEDRLNPMPGSAPAEPPATIRTREDFAALASRLTGRRTPLAREVPDVTVLRVGPERWIFTMIANRGYAFHNRILFEDLAREPDEDTISIVPGLIGNYPEMFVDVPLEEAPELVERMEQVGSREDWQDLVSELADHQRGELQVIARHSPSFWPFVDELHDWLLTEDPVGSGILDLSEYVWPR